MQETRVRSLSQEDSLEKGMVTHSSILAWSEQRSLVGYNPWGLKVGHDWATEHACMHTQDEKDFKLQKVKEKP